MSVRVPDERLDAREANLTAALTWVPHPHRVPAAADLAALVANLRDARADNQRLRAILNAMLDPEWWSEEVDVNGEYTTTRARGYYEVVGEVRAALNWAPLCKCGHIHAADVDGSDVGCRVCECASFESAP